MGELEHLVVSMAMSWCSRGALAALLSMVASCDDEFRPEDDGTVAGDRGSWDPGKADGEATCVGACGAKADAGCWCDDQCAMYGDCCPDVEPVCGFDDGGAGDAGDHGGVVTAQMLLDVTQSCQRLVGTTKFKTDSGSSATIEICQLDGAVWWRADADIDCDGGSSAQCQSDPWYQSSTSAKDSSGNFVDSSVVPHLVVPGKSNGFDPAALGIKTGWSARGSAGAMIYDGKLVYGPYADTGPKGIIGELSAAAAKVLGIPDSPVSGGVASGVTYIVFTDDDAFIDPIESASEAQSIGNMLAARLLADNGGPNIDPSPTAPPDPGPGPSDPNSVCFPGADGSGNTCLPTVAPGNVSGYGYPSPLNNNDRKPIRYLDLQAIDADTKIAPNFKLSEVAQLYKGRYAVVQPDAIERLQAMRNSAGALKINSGYRSPTYNSGVGGAPRSRHMYGDGFDIDPISISVNSLEPKCAQNGGKLVEYSSHVHCDWRNDPVDTTFFGNTVVSSEPFGLGWSDYTGRIEPDGDGFVTVVEGFDEGEPVQRWTALDADGATLAEGVGARFVPPSRTATVQVDVGRAIDLELELQ